LPRRSLVSNAILSVRQAAEFFGTTEKAIRRRIEGGKLPYRKMGTKVVFIKSDLERFVERLPGLSPRDAEANLRAKEDP
jgi:excisionase family DNA binding protein